MALSKNEKVGTFVAVVVTLVLFLFFNNSLIPGSDSPDSNLDAARDSLNVDSESEGIEVEIENVVVGDGDTEGQDSEEEEE